MNKECHINGFSLNGEKWRYITDTNEYYAVSSLGRVVSFKRAKPKILSIVIQNSRGREYAHVCINNKKVRVHRLVATAFLDNTNNYNEVDHINNNPLDNRACNLRWATHAENMNNPLTREKQQQYLPGSKNPKASFYNFHEDKMKAVVQIQNEKVVAKYKSLGEAENSGYKKTSISAVLNGRLKTYRGYKWVLLKDYLKKQ